MTEPEPADAGAGAATEPAAAPAPAPTPAPRSPVPDAAKRELQDELDSIRATGEDLHG